MGLGECILGRCGHVGEKASDDCNARAMHVLAREWASQEQLHGWLCPSCLCYGHEKPCAGAQQPCRTCCAAGRPMKLAGRPVKATPKNAALRRRSRIEYATAQHATGQQEDRVKALKGHGFVSK